METNLSKVLAYWFVGLTFLVFSGWSNSESLTVHLIDASDSYNLNNYLSFIEDPEDALTIDQVSVADYAEKFQRVKKNTLNRGYSNSAFWFKFSLYNESSKIKRWNLVYRVPDSLRVDLYSPTENNSFSVIKSGMKVAVKERVIPVIPIVLPIKIAPGETKTFYINYFHGYKSHVNLHLDSIKGSKGIHQKKIKIEYFFVGFVLALLLYNLVLLLSLRDINYFYYILFFLSYIGTRYGHSGLFLKWIAAEDSVWIHYITCIFGISAAILALQFARSFLSARQVIPRFDWFILVLMGLFVLEVLLLLFLPIASVRPLHHAFAIVAYCSVLVAAFLCWRAGVDYALYLLIAWVPFVIGFVFFIIQWSGLLPVVRLEGGSALMLFASIEMVSWSFALAGRIKSTNREKQRAQLAEKTIRTENELLLREGVRREHAEKEILQSKQQLLHLLDCSQEAIIVVYQNGEISFLNSVMEQWLGLEKSECQASNIVSLFRNGAELVQLMKEFPRGVKDDSRSLQLQYKHRDQTEQQFNAYLFQLNTLEKPSFGLVLSPDTLDEQHGSPIENRLMVVKDALKGVVSFLPQSANSPGFDSSQAWEKLTREEFDEVFRHTLVEVMCLALDYWEQSMRATRYDLAEKSGIWRVYQDRGTLNTKTMDRYLSLQKIPQNPRWKDVVHTANYVLENCPVTDVLVPLKISLENSLMQLNTLSLLKRNKN